MNVAVPAATPVTTPAFVTVAIALLLLAHVPPVVGDKVVVAPTHTDVLPVILTVGSAFTVEDPVMVVVQPVRRFVAITVYVPTVV